jgi:hypothetical protein
MADMCLPPALFVCGSLAVFIPNIIICPNFMTNYLFRINNIFSGKENQATANIRGTDTECTVDYFEHVKIVDICVDFHTSALWR